MNVIIYTGQNGRCMIFGRIENDELPLPGESVRIYDARMILRVETVGNLGIAAIGPKDGSDTRLTAPVPQTTCVVTSAAECTDNASEKMVSWPVWGES
jgi:hypothetical protein